MRAGANADTGGGEVGGSWLSPSHFFFLSFGFAVPHATSGTLVAYMHMLLTHFCCIRLYVTLGLQAARLLRPCDSPGKNTRVGCHASSRGSSEPGIDPGLLHCSQVLSHLSHQGESSIMCLLTDNIIIIMY